MCCDYSKSATRKLRARIKKTKRQEIVCWKILTVRRSRLYSPVFTCFRWKPGIVESDRESRIQHTYAVYEGIHVYTSKNAGLKRCYENLNQVLVPVICCLSDLVCAGDNEDAVLMKVRLRKKDYDAAIFAKVAAR